VLASSEKKSSHEFAMKEGSENCLGRDVLFIRGGDKSLALSQAI